MTSSTSHSPLVRFAPSPTGYLHIGNARPALFNWLFARRHHGRFLLRYDDTDIARSKAEYADAIAEDLRWLGIRPDAVIRQSERLAIYDAAADQLRAAGRLYACYETPDELDRRRKRQLARGLPPIYDRAALKLTAEQKAAFAAEGRKPHWRFLLEARDIAWDDLVRGPSHVDCASLSDPVLVREDGSYLYTLPSVVDDVETGVSHVIRGEDHVTNTAVQAQIFEALGAALPVFGHHNLLTTASGEGLSKRLGHLSLRGLRESGVTAFFTRSSAANIPVNMALCQKLGLEEDTYSVSIPLGATINMAGAAITITVLTLAAVNTLGVAVDLPTALLLSIVAAVCACGASGVAGGSLLLIPVACSLFGISNDLAMQVVGVGFIIGVLQDSAETALNSSTDVLFTAAGSGLPQPSAR